MNRILSTGVGTALALAIFSCSENSLTGANNFSADDLSADAARVAAVAVSFGSNPIAVGATTLATAVLTNSEGRPINRTVTWTSGNPAVATVSAAGIVTGVAEGTASITAARSDKTGSATITVTALSATGTTRVAKVTVSLVAGSLSPGQSTQATATTYDSTNNVLAGRTISWSSSNAAVATVSTSGLVTALAAGTSQIIATSEEKSGSAAITVSTTPPPEINPGSVHDLAVSATESTSATLSFTQVGDGTGQPAKYDVRFAIAPIAWGSAPSVTSGTCAAPLA